MIVVDTTILVYAKGVDHPLRAPCRELLRAIEGGRLTATTTAEAIQEFAHVRAARRPRKDAARVARRYMELLSPLAPVESDDLRRGLGIFQRHGGLGSFDAVLAAVAMGLDDDLVSTDRAFASVSGLRHVHPLSSDFDRLLG